MMKLLIQQNQALKRAARLIIAYETRLGVISLAENNPIHPANTEHIHQEINQALTAFHLWRKWRGEYEPARAALLEMWASGKWTNRDTCVRQCYRLAGFKNMVTARQALVGAPAPLVVRSQPAPWVKL